MKTLKAYFCLLLMLLTVAASSAKELELKKFPQEKSFELYTLYQNGKAQHQALDLTILPSGEWQMTLRLAFFGAALFGYSQKKDLDALAEVFANSQDPMFLPPEGIFDLKNYQKTEGGRQSLSLMNHEPMAELIRHQMEKAQRPFNIPKEIFGIPVNLKIEIVEVDELELYKKIGVSKPTRGNAADLYEAFKKGPLNYHPIVILPVPDANVVTPDFWDFYSDGWYLTHEILHLISRQPFNDGFAYMDYPLDGITGDGSMLRELDKLGYEPVLDVSLFQDLINGHKPLKDLFGLQKEAFSQQGRPFKHYMNSDAKGNYSDDPKVYWNNIKTKVEAFKEFAKKNPQRVRQAISSEALLGLPRSIKNSSKACHKVRRTI